MQEALQLLEATTVLRPRTAIILGSGLGEAAARLTGAVSIPYSGIPGWPQSGAPGHRGVLAIGEWRGTPVAVAQGRAHLYEGYTPRQVAFPVRLLRAFGVGRLVLTSAAGGIRDDLTPGCCGVISDHINLQGVTPLSSSGEQPAAPQFLDMTDAYSRRLRALARQAAARVNLLLPEAVYAALTGPNFETPAEVRLLRAAGADMVGMSIVQETVEARRLAMEVLAISAITNRAAGLGNGPLSHQDVLKLGPKLAALIADLLDALLPTLPPDTE